MQAFKKYTLTGLYKDSSWRLSHDLTNVDFYSLIGTQKRPVSELSLLLSCA